MKNIFLLAYFIALCGCSTHTQWKSHYHTSTVQFEQDGALCQLEADQSYRSNTYTSSTGKIENTRYSGHYDPSSGYYSGVSTKTENVHPLAPVVDAIVKGNDSQRVFELCMKSKGYYQVLNSIENNSNFSRYSQANEADSKCANSLDCAPGFYCDNGSCRNTEKAKAEYEKNTKSKQERKDSSEADSKCANSLDCAPGFYCDSGSCRNTDEAKRIEQLKKF